MGDVTGEFLAALVIAPEERKREALRVLRGERGPERKDGKETEPFVTLKECGARLGLSACSLWRWRVPGHSLGGRRKFRLSEVEAYLGSEAFKKRAAELREEERERRAEGGNLRPEGRRERGEGGWEM